MMDVERYSIILPSRKGVFTTQAEGNDGASLRCSFLRASSWLGGVSREPSHILFIYASARLRDYYVFRFSQGQLAETGGIINNTARTKVDSTEHPVQFPHIPSVRGRFGDYSVALCSSNRLRSLFRKNSG